jgi:esterase/lipase superfamily enzyme
LNREYHKWFSPSLGRGMELLVFGWGGAPVIIFPSSMGRFFEAEDRGLVGSLADKIEAGHIQVYCVDAIDLETWYNYGASIGWRVGRHMAYERYLRDEVVPLMRQKNPNGYIITTGCSFGAFHAVNFAFRHPNLVHKVVALGGRYDMKPYFRGEWSEELYYNSPMDYINGLQWGQLRDEINAIEITLCSGEQDLPLCRGETIQLHHLLNSKGIGNRLEVWGDIGHDWPYWNRQIRSFI